MRVCVCPADEGGCGFYRLRWPTAVLQSQGYDVVLSEDGSQERADEFDVVVFQRPLSRILVDYIPVLQGAGVAVVVELDDDFSSIHPSSPAFKPFHPKYSPDRNWHHLKRACQMADLVTVSTPTLAEKWGWGKAFVLPNYVPERYLDVEVSHEHLRVGWTGTPQTHIGDLEVTGSAVKRALGDATFVSIGSAATLEVLGIPGVIEPWAELQQDYPRLIASLDVGIVPLVLSAFNQAKSWLKGLEYAALGVPFIASPTDEYLRLSKAGAGVLAHRPRDWERQLRRLLTDDRFRTELAASGRSTATELTYEKNAWKWLEAWNIARAKRLAA